MKPLSSLEEQFVEQYTSRDKKLSDNKIINNLWPKILNPQHKLKRLLKDERIQSSIEKMYDIRRFKISYNEKDILDKLWIEAQRDDKYSTHASRIGALVWLGKHIGMWKDKLLDQSGGNVTYNIINYSPKDSTLEKNIQESIESNKEEIKEITNEPSEIKIIDYNE